MGVNEVPLRIVVGDDQLIVREGVVRMLEEAGFEVVGVAGDAEDLVRKARGHKPDVVVTDIQMPPEHSDDGLKAALRIRRELPGTGVLVLSQYLEDRYALELVADDAAGAGYLLKDRVGDVRAFAEAVRRVAAGGSVLDPEVVATMVGRQRIDSPLDRLTPRERDVIPLMAEGRSNRAIADELVVTTAAVERHVTSIFDKLGLQQSAEDHRRVLAVLRYLRG
jgi:DNA-binding NarL/FixJ family response regulator